jgi:hypothetical protein
MAYGRSIWKRFEMSTLRVCDECCRLQHPLALEVNCHEALNSTSFEPHM